MKLMLAILFFFTSTAATNNKQASMPEKKYTYLALGDSYTIGESVPSKENFPNQLTGQLISEGISMKPARIIAKTGWTTDELENGIVVANDASQLLSSYDFVSLLIGVNNQYRGRSVNEYKSEFEELLRKAVAFAGERADHVVVLSIPDWGITPFAEGRDRAQIGREIDAYNAANKQLAGQYHVHYIDITPWTREAAADNSLLTSDGLHPSGKEYKRWAEKLLAYFKTRLN